MVTTESTKLWIKCIIILILIGIVIGVIYFFIDEPLLGGIMHEKFGAIGAGGAPISKGGVPPSRYEEKKFSYGNASFFGIIIVAIILALFYFRRRRRVEGAEEELPPEVPGDEISQDDIEREGKKPVRRDKKVGQVRSKKIPKSEVEEKLPPEVPRDEISQDYIEREGKKPVRRDKKVGQFKRSKKIPKSEVEDTGLVKVVLSDCKYLSNNLLRFGLTIQNHSDCVAVVASVAIRGKAITNKIVTIPTQDPVTKESIKIPPRTESKIKSEASDGYFYVSSIQKFASSENEDDRRVTVTPTFVLVPYKSKLYK